MVYPSTGMLTQFPSEAVRLKVPFSIKPWTSSESNIGNLLMVPPDVILQHLLSFSLNPRTTHSSTNPSPKNGKRRFKIVLKKKVLLPCVDQGHICEAEVYKD